MRGSAKMRAVIACVGMCVLFTVFSFRLVYLQVYKHAEYLALSPSKFHGRQVLPARRGTIEDVNHEVVAENEMLKTVVADPMLVTNPGAVAKVLGKDLKMNRLNLAETLSGTEKYVVLKKQVPETEADEIADELRSKSLRGISFESEPARFYPNGSVLCHVIGCVDRKGSEVTGIERGMDQYLRGSDGFRYTEHDRSGNEIVPYRGLEHAARDGLTVRLTVDMGIQAIVEEELDAAVKTYSPEMAVAIVMRPKTGEILALANRPSFDLNDFGKSSHGMMVDQAVETTVEPGSTFKIVTVAGVFNEHLVHPDTMIFCNNGLFSYGGRTLRDHKNFADLSVNDILVKSSNIGAAKLAMLMGDEKLYEYIRRFGFGERTGIPLPGETAGLLRPPHAWDKLAITRIPMGQGVGVTPLQIITAMSAIANGGHLMMPQIVHEITDEQGDVKMSFPPVEIRQAVSPEAAAMVREALKGVVSRQGTAEGAEVPGYTVAGKTGTAEKHNPNGGYIKGKYVVSFIGFLPADNPEFVCLVMLDDAKGQSEERNYGGVIAGPIFSQIAGRTARYLNLEPHPEDLSQKIAQDHSPAQH